MNTKNLLLGTILAASFACTAFAPANAQEVEPAADNAVGVDDYDRDDDLDDDDDGFDWGLLGLLGLLGLIPRKRTEVVVPRDDVNRNPPGPDGPNRM